MFLNVFADNDIIIVTPVHPVTEGDFLTLGCRLRTGKVPSRVSFYKNGELIQNNTRMELFIAAVSKSDEGFYKCEGRDSLQGSWTSAESWVSVKCEFGNFILTLDHSGQFKGPPI